MRFPVAILTFAMCTSVLLPSGAHAAGMSVGSGEDDGPSIITIRSIHEWCTTAGGCAGLNGRANYEYAEADAFTFSPLFAGHAVSPPNELYAACSHAYTDSQGSRRFDEATVQGQSQTLPNPLAGSLSGLIGVTSRDSGWQSPSSTGFIIGTVSRAGSFTASSTSGPVSYSASDTATITGSQTTDNSTFRLIRGGFGIRITGTILHFHRIVDPVFGTEWSFDGTTTGFMTCSTVTQTGEAATTQSSGDGVYASPD